MSQPEQLPHDHIHEVLAVAPEHSCHVDCHHEAIDTQIDTTHLHEHDHHEGCGHQHHADVEAAIDHPHVHTEHCGHVTNKLAEVHIDHAEQHIHSKGCGHVNHEEAHVHVDRPERTVVEDRTPLPVIAARQEETNIPEKTVAAFEQEIVSSTEPDVAVPAVAPTEVVLPIVKPTVEVRQREIFEPAPVDLVSRTVEAVVEPAKDDIETVETNTPASLDAYEDETVAQPQPVALTKQAVVPPKPSAVMHMALTAEPNEAVFTTIDSESSEAQPVEQQVDIETPADTIPMAPEVVIEADTAAAEPTIALPLVHVDNAETMTTHQTEVIIEPTILADVVAQIVAEHGEQPADESVQSRRIETVLKPYRLTLSTEAFMTLRTAVYDELTLEMPAIGERLIEQTRAGQFRENDALSTSDDTGFLRRLIGSLALIRFGLRSHSQTIT